MATSPFPKEGQGLRAVVKIGEDIHWILMTWYTGASGYAWGIFDARVNKNWVRQAWAQDYDDGRVQAEEAAKMSYRYIGRKEPFPKLNWQETGSGEAGPVAQTG